MQEQGQRSCGRCGNQLSNYNAGPLCFTCTRSRPVEPHLPAVPEHVWSDPDVRGALVAWDFGRVSSLIRLRGSLRQDDLAQLTGLSQAFLSMLEAGSRRLTNIDKIVQFLTGLSVPAELVPLPLPRSTLTSSVHGLVPVPSDADPSLPWTTTRMLVALDIAMEGAEVHRRGFLAAGGVALTAFVNQWDAAEAEPLHRAAEGSRLPQVLLSSLQLTTDHLRTMDATSWQRHSQNAR